MSEEGGVWRTIGGRRVFIKDGEDIATAMKKSGKFNNDKNNGLDKVQKEIDDFIKNDKDKKIRTVIHTETLDEYGNTKAIDDHLVSLPGNTINEIKYNYDETYFGKNKVFEVHLKNGNEILKKIKINKID